MKKILISITLFCLCIALGACGKADIIKEPALAIAQETEVAVKAEETPYEEIKETSYEETKETPATVPSVISAPLVPHSNRYFFPEGLSEIEVGCKMRDLGVEFIGKATLKINELPDTRLGNFYELILTDLEGECDEIDPEQWGIDPYADLDYHPFFSEKFLLGYFYVTDNEIYRVEPDFDGRYKRMLSELPMFPSTQEYVEHRKNEVLEQVFYSSELVCTMDGLEDTYDPDAGEWIIKEYHRFISVEGDEVHYNRYRADSDNSNDGDYLFWKRDQGLVYFFCGWMAKGDNIAFWLPSYGNPRDSVF